MENMDKGLAVPKWVLMVWLKIPQMPQNLFAQIAYPNENILDFNEKKASLGVCSPSKQLMQLLGSCEGFRKRTKFPTRFHNMVK